MKKSILILICLFTILISQAQQTDLEVKALKIDINANGIIDEIKPSTDALHLNIDNKSYTIPYELLGFEFLSKLSFINNVLIISGYNSGTGAYSWTYKFRNNKLTNKIELIGYDDFNKWVSGHIKTSINTLTNKWEVIIEEYNPTKEIMETSKHTGKISIRKIGLTDIKEQDIQKLTEIGMKYWN
ncbi:exported hypothetical protein [Flavobacterium sp. 9AF]|uniref:hypothetical protein n=1 Tax=Flavobacterium sp. 9AF TaxID=2653142 RepID=UPI0012F195AC|nr:hypothetical protein [Flavobacterium sp. 9AF]VXB56936.1 exported hypothetical protein [Flavobacterium sp. 9AF]